MQKQSLLKTNNENFLRKGSVLTDTSENELSWDDDDFFYDEEDYYFGDESDWGWDDDTISDEEWIEGMQIYFLNVVKASRIITPIMQKQKNGSIINISTFAIFEPDSNFPTSGAFRSSLAAFTKIYSDKYATDNIRMNNILPGFIDSLPAKEEFLKKIPLKRYGKVSEISSVVEMLASEGGAYITGQNIRVDGGITRSV